MYMNITTAIVDDNPGDLTLIRTCMEQLVDGLEYSFSIETFRDIEERLLSSSFDVYILDIDLNELSGFDLAARISKTNPDGVIMFVTSHSELVFDAFSYNTFFFIRKDRLEADLKNALKKLIRETDTKNRTFSISYNGDLIAIVYRKIMFIEAFGNHVYINTESGRQYTVPGPLKIVASQLPDGMFAAASRSYFVNLNYVDEITQMHVILKDGTKIKIAKNRYEQFTADFVRWMSR